MTTTAPPTEAQKVAPAFDTLTYEPIASLKSEAIIPQPIRDMVNTALEDPKGKTLKLVLPTVEHVAAFRTHLRSLQHLREAGMFRQTCVVQPDGLTVHVRIQPPKDKPAETADKPAETAGKPKGK